MEPGSLDRDDVHVDAEVGLEFVSHAAEARTEGVEHARGVGDARMTRLHRFNRRQCGLLNGAPGGLDAVPSTRRRPRPRPRAGQGAGACGDSSGTPVATKGGRNLPCRAICGDESPPAIVTLFLAGRGRGASRRACGCRGTDAAPEILPRRRVARRHRGARALLGGRSHLHAFGRRAHRQGRHPRGPARKARNRPAADGVLRRGHPHPAVRRHGDRRLPPRRHDGQRRPETLTTSSIPEPS